MKRNIVLLIATAPILGIAWYLCGGGPQKSQSPVVSNGKHAQSQSIHKPRENAKDQTGPGSQPAGRPTERDLALDKLTLQRLDSATEASKMKASDFGKNDDFLLKKHQVLFDSWALSGSERNQFVRVLGEDGARAAEIMLESAKTWPLEVGHSGNRELLTRQLNRLFYAA